MTATEVRALVGDQIGGDWAHTNHHGVELRRCLLAEPRRIAVQLLADAPVTEGVWLVLEEEPGAAGGYLVTYSERSGSFGLAHFAPDTPPYLIGEYGGFFDALDAM